MTDPQAFYSGGDFWRVRDDPTQRDGARSQPPYYLTLQMPGQAEPAFSLTTTFVPTGDRNNLAAFVAVNADPGRGLRQDPGAQLPRSVQINGPAQVQNQLHVRRRGRRGDQHPRARATEVRYGNLLTLPVGGGLLYVEPVYVQADAATAFPLLRKVLVSFGDTIAFEDTLEEALDTVFAAEGGVDTEEPGKPTRADRRPDGDAGGPERRARGCAGQTLSRPSGRRARRSGGGRLHRVRRGPGRPARTRSTGRWPRSGQVAAPGPTHPRRPGRHHRRPGRPHRPEPVARAVGLIPLICRRPRG